MKVPRPAGSRHTPGKPGGQTAFWRSKANLGETLTSTFADLLPTETFSAHEFTLRLAAENNRLVSYPFGYGCGCAPMPADPLTATFAALADPTRRAILARLAQGDVTVKELAEPFASSGPAISRHLAHPRTGIA
jgi:hypothetical protein